MANCCRCFSDKMSGPKVPGIMKKEHKRKKHMKDKLQGKRMLCFLLSVLMLRFFGPVTAGAGESTSLITESSDRTIEITSKPEGSDGTAETESGSEDRDGIMDNTPTQSGDSGGTADNTSSVSGDSEEIAGNTSSGSDDSGGTAENASPVSGGSGETSGNASSVPGGSEETAENASSVPGSSNASLESENNDGTEEAMSESETGDIAAVDLLADPESEDDESENDAEVGNTPGDVSYIITIPDQVDFGTLTQPETESDSYIFRGLNVTATQLSNLTEKQKVAVYIKDSSSGDGRFRLTQQGASDPFYIPYDIYDHTVNDQTVSSAIPVNRSENSNAQGYLLCDFGSGSEGTVQTAVLALNQIELYGKDLSVIAGNYSGTITFHSEIKTMGN